MAVFSGSYSIFEERVNDLMSCHLILAERSISLLLKCVASTPELTTTVSNTLAEVSYADEFDRSRVFYIKDGKTRLKFVVPQDKNRAFTLVVCLLTEIDTGRRNLLEFLKDYFADVDDSASYQKFCQNVLKPFKKAGESILRSLSPTEVQVESAELADKFFVSSRVKISTELVKKICDELESFKIKLNAEIFANSLQKEECLLLATALKNAVIAQNAVLIRPLWVGYKNTVKANKVSDAASRKLQKMLSEAKLI